MIARSRPVGSGPKDPFSAMVESKSEGREPGCLPCSLIAACARTAWSWRSVAAGEAHVRPPCEFGRHLMPSAHSYGQSLIVWERSNVHVSVGTEVCSNAFLSEVRMMLSQNVVNCATADALVTSITKASRSL